MNGSSDPYVAEAYADNIVNNGAVGSRWSRVYGMVLDIHKTAKVQQSRLTLPFFIPYVGPRNTPPAFHCEGTSKLSSSQSTLSKQPSRRPKSKGRSFARSTAATTRSYARSTAATTATRGLCGTSPLGTRARSVSRIDADAQTTPPTHTHPFFLTYTPHTYSVAITLSRLVGFRKGHNLTNASFALVLHRFDVVNAMMTCAQTHAEPSVE